MLRSLLISLSKARWAQKMVSNWGLARKMVVRFVAGETLSEAVEVVQKLNQVGMAATIDQLGENTTSSEEAAAATQGVLSILDAIQKNQLRANVSVKMSQIGLTLDEELCRKNLGKILKQAAWFGNFVRIDMEDSTLTEKTLGVYLWAREVGFDNVGIVIQSYLYRSADDLRILKRFDTRVRLCKGAYKEPSSVAFPKKSQVDQNYDELMSLLFDSTRTWKYPRISADGRTPPIPGVATHDTVRIKYAKTLAAERQIPKDAFEFQMLYGIRRDLQEQLVADGYPVRIYVPFGTHWYPYFMRRLAERPANLWFFASNFFRR